MMNLPKIFISLILVSFTLFAGGCKNRVVNNVTREQPVTHASPQEAAQAAILEQVLRQSALDGETESVIQLLRTEPNVNARDEDGRTALMYAAFNGHKEIAAALIENGAEVDLRDFMDRTALLFASTGDFAETVELLLKEGADPNIIDNNEHFSSLMHAAAEGHIEVVKILLKNGANPYLKDIDGDDAETFARQNGHIEVADFIKQKK